MRQTKKKIFRVKTLVKFAKSISKDFEILYSKQDGYWLITDKEDIYIGEDSQGAMFQLMEVSRKRN